MIRSRFASHGTIFSATDAHHHLVQNISLAFHLQTMIPLIQSDLAMQVVEKVATSAYGKIEIER